MYRIRWFSEDGTCLSADVITSTLDNIYIYKLSSSQFHACKMLQFIHPLTVRPLPLDAIALFRLEPALGLHDRGLVIGGRLVRRPHPLNAQLKRALDAVRQPDPDSRHALPQNLRLRLHDEAVVCPDKVVPLDEHRLPLSGPLGEEPVLVQVGGLDALGLDVDKVGAAVGLDAQREVDVRVNVPDGLAEQGGGLGRGAKGGVAGALDLEEVGGEGGGYGAVEAGV